MAAVRSLINFPFSSGVHDLMMHELLLPFYSLAAVMHVHPLPLFLLLSDSSFLPSWWLPGSGLCGLAAGKKHTTSLRVPRGSLNPVLMELTHV